MELKYIESKKELLQLIIQFIDDDTVNDDDFNKLIKFIDDNKISENQGDFSILLYILNNLSLYHYRKQGFFEKIEKIINNYIDKIKQNFTEIEIGQIFISSKRILYYLIQNKIISANIINNFELVFGTKSYFQPELHPAAFTAEIGSDQTSIQIFENNRQKGENPTQLAQLIRDDSVAEFVTLVSQGNISLNSQISPSLFETHGELFKSVSLIEYAAFFGSTNVFKYLQANDVPLPPSLWLFAVRGQSAEIIHVLEDARVGLPEGGAKRCYAEAIKCHHDAIADYFESFSLSEDEKEEGCGVASIQFYNFLYFPSNFNTNKISMELVAGNYVDLILMLAERDNFVVDDEMIGKITRKNVGYKRLLNFLCERVHSIPIGCLSDSDLTEFVYPNGQLRSIGQKAFFRSVDLTTVVLPPTVRTIEVGAFAFCTNLRKVTLASIGEISEYTFLKCGELLEVTVPSAVKAIKMCAFSGCAKLESVVFEEGSLLEEVGEFAFNGCVSLKNMKIPASAKNISPSAFYNCYSSSY